MSLENLIHLGQGGSNMTTLRNRSSMPYDNVLSEYCEQLSKSVQSTEHWPTSERSEIIPSYEEDFPVEILLTLVI